jgi:hypothetical protein
MRSRAEWALRAVVLAALGLLFMVALRSAERARQTVVVRGGLRRALVDATRRPVAALAVELDSVPGPVERDWLAAIRDAGTSVTWSAGDIEPIAIATAAVAEPEGRVRLVIGGADSADAVVADALGAIDTVELRGNSASRLLRTATGSVTASTRGVRATAPLPAPARVRRLLVLAAAGWESKFAVAALEEAGWIVDARIRVAPGSETRQGADFGLDTARYSAVIALDGAAAASAAAIERYVAAGGGAVLSGAVTRLPAFTRVTPAVATTRRVPEPRGGVALGAVKPGAVVLQSERGAPLVVAGRTGLGRVLATGYGETWRWRMRAASDAPAQHREWWGALVSAVAYAPPAARDSASFAGDPAPVAALTAALGPRSTSRQPHAGRLSRVPPWLLFGLFLISLLGEVVSRRLRGLA